MLPIVNGARFLKLPSLVQRFWYQGLFSEDESSMVKVFGATLLNIRPPLTFLVMAETMLSRCRSTLKSFLARVMISVMWRGF